MRFTERAELPVGEQRITVSEVCRSKILQDLEKLLNKKSKEPADNKLRLNIIKKID
jgi:hypothetical protein